MSERDPTRAPPQGRDPAVERLLRSEAPTVIVEPSPVREPIRAAIAVGAAIAIAGSLLPWATPERAPNQQQQTGWTGEAGGFLIGLAAALTVYLVVNRAAAATRSLTIRVLPLFLGLAALALWLGSRQTMERIVEDWRRTGYVASIQPGLYVCLVGTLIFAAGGIWLGARAGFSNVRPGDPSDAVTIRGRQVALVFLSGTGAIVGLLGGGLGAYWLLGSSPFVALPLALVSAIGLIVGANLGARLAGAIHGGEPRPAQGGLARPSGAGTSTVRVERVRPERRPPPER